MYIFIMEIDPLDKWVTDVELKIFWSVTISVRGRITLGYGSIAECKR
jgi:hypothetical protein